MVKGRIERIASFSRAQEALASFHSRKNEIIDWIIAIQQIPAPSFQEFERAQYIESQFKQLGLRDVWRDDIHNVYGRFPGSNPSANKPVIISAHSDTVFPAGTNLRIHKVDHMLYGPGIGDNSTGVAGLFAVADTIRSFALQPRADTWFVSNVCEEGLGDLRGMRAVVDHFGRQATYIVVEGGLFGQIAHEAVGVRRFRIGVETPGGHSWGSFGTASAIHEISHLIAAIARLNVPDRPKTTYNVGVIEGGTSVNTIASSASMLLDLRSENEAELERLVNLVSDIISRTQQRAARRRTSVKFSIEPVGNRPAGRIPRNTPIVRWAEEALRYSGSRSVIYVAGSTDANIPLSLGIPSVCIGLTESANAHRLDEYIDPERLPCGLKQLLLIALAAGNYHNLD
ncbi:MAG: M20/M25/M40 family metallo-hydrolase [Candidatus Promineifilaceae bacterium]